MKLLTCSFSLVHGTMEKVYIKWLNSDHSMYIFLLLSRGEQHGEQMLSHISVIIEQSKHPLAIALATDALADLCKCDVRPSFALSVYTHTCTWLMIYQIVDPVSVWSILGELLSQDPRYVKHWFLSRSICSVV